MFFLHCDQGKNTSWDLTYYTKKTLAQRTLVQDTKPPPHEIQNPLDIVKEIIIKLQQRVKTGVTTLSIKEKDHRGYTPRCRNGTTKGR